MHGIQLLSRISVDRGAVVTDGEVSINKLCLTSFIK